MRMVVADSDAESEVDIQVADVQESSEVDEDDGADQDEDVEGEDEEAGQDELAGDSDDEMETESVPEVAPLRIKLKLGAQPQASSSRQPAKRWAQSRNEDVESEDSESGEDEDEDDSQLGAPTPKNRTARQAALAGETELSHVTLDSTRSNPNKKAQYSATEVALRKEENARKRKNMIEKKLEDEKLETINRLLKKQTRPRGNKRATAPQSEEDVDMEDEEREGVSNGSQIEEPTVPTMFRWISTSRPLPHSGSLSDATLSDHVEPSPSPHLALMFSVPDTFLPLKTSHDEEKKPKLDTDSLVCAVDGCVADRRYRVVGKAWGVGACGLGHLKLLEGRAL
ncbi:unnamed protein product [Mycena citricolor]|uniref:INO80 complex subunit B-like conserved region domain-containing protein n=1 Tax=Mycena citricolor TaxID=2018698 RepID=A0AAD2HUN1_9AGAR|nr:unnamed protein product [Mycena citricolor]CAK5281088.1 unnamed protein product [Mycena citricolor]